MRPRCEFILDRCGKSSELVIESQRSFHGISLPRNQSMMRSSSIRLAVVLGVALCAGSLVHAQRSSQMTFRSAERVGLVPVWSKAIGTGYRGKITGVTVHVSPTKTFRGSEVADKFGNRTFFSERDVVPVSRGGYDQTNRLADLRKATLDARGLEASVEQKEISDVTLYVRSSLGTVSALDAETGQAKWTTQAGTPGYPSYSVSATDTYVVTISGSTLYLLDAESGEVLDAVSTNYIPGATPTVNGDLIYIPTWKGLVEVVSATDLGRMQFTVGSSGRISTPITVSQSTASWSTSAGHIYVANSNSPGLLYHFQSLDQIATSPVSMDGNLYATSTDGFTYALDEATGDVKWRYSAGGPIEEAPLAVEGCIYVTTIDGQMSALDAASGEVKWLGSGIDRFVAVSDSAIYCITMDGMLTAFDRSTGGKIGSTVTGKLGLSVTNTNTDRVYLVTKSGVVHCLREPRNRWPITRVVKPAVEEEVVEGEGDKPTSIPSSPSAGQDDVVDPDDPFGNLDITEDTGEEAGTEVDAGDAGGDFGADDEDPFGDGDMGLDDEDPFADF